MIYVMIQLAINCLVSYFLDLMSQSWSAFVECDRPIRITGSYLSRSRVDLFWNRALKSPLWLSNSFLHLPLVTKKTMVMVMNDRHPYLSFNINHTFHSISISPPIILTFENPWSRPFMWPKVKVIWLAQQPIDLLSLYSKSTGPAIPEIQQFKNSHDKGQN